MTGVFGHSVLSIFLKARASRFSNEYRIALGYFP